MSQQDARHNASTEMQIPLVNSPKCVPVAAENAAFLRQYEWYLVPVDGSEYAATFITNAAGETHRVFMHDMVWLLEGMRATEKASGRARRR